ncbi:hypothetical protein ACIPF8_22210, partial [Collimonas sp. NPDC087041]|uniref:hypothetical protein n=1 Tax=Collimonas sp. NPDC087041 TaxID=3363960 RepID=UPI00380799D0
MAAWIGRQLQLVGCALLPTRKVGQSLSKFGVGRNLPTLQLGESVPALPGRFFCWMAAWIDRQMQLVGWALVLTRKVGQSLSKFGVGRNLPTLQLGESVPALPGRFFCWMA